MRRVVITGLGAISPHGLGAPAFWNALLEGKSSITALTRFDPAAFPSRVAGQVPPFKTTEYVPKSYRKATKIMARDIELAVVAADLAVKDAKLLTKGIAGSLPPEKTAEGSGWFKPDPTRVGCNIGAGLICADMDELTSAMALARNSDNTLSLAKWGRSDDPAKTSGMENLTPLWLLKYLPNMLACHVSIIHDTQGPSNTITCEQASAGLALAEAARTIQRGNADIALVGGCETKVHPMGLMRWTLLNRLNAQSNDNPAAACKPYDKDATGSVLAEGGAVLVIEEYEHAKRRGATIYAEVVGLGASSNAALCVTETDESGEAPGVALKKALKDAQVSTDQVGLIIPSGYGIPNWDRADANALKAALGPALATTTITAARAGIGDCGAGAQALDLVAATLALHSQTIPPTANTQHPIANLPLATTKQTKSFTHAAVLTTALGGQNSAVILKAVQ
ncbi:MAG TPA: beta-ketoacyl-[acyl-carrier-protein] synthase family protein [Phycisphaerae bacterium]|nr:beta-ketoacyl-[acyl-carrier-protein] synthase family protein [Phycisphaerae bacterium]